MSMQEKVVLITGATGGLGQVAARKMAGTGASLALLGRSPAKLEGLAEELGLPAGKILLLEADLSDPSEAAAAAQAVAQKFGRLDVLLHVVGGWVGGKTVVDLDLADVASMLDQHAWTTLHVAQHLIPLMVENGWGRFMVVSAPAATSPSAKGAPYAMGKAAQQVLMLTLAQELKGSGVTANILSVNAIDVDHHKDRDPAGKYASWATPEEIVAAMLYLCTAEAQMVNGAVLPLYGSP